MYINFHHIFTLIIGSISFDQFSAIMHSEKRTTMADLMKAFRKIDLNGDGFISHDELYKTLTKVEMCTCVCSEHVCV